MNIAKLILIVLCLSSTYSCTTNNETKAPSPSKTDIEKVIPKEKNNIDYKALYEITPVLNK